MIWSKSPAHSRSRSRPSTPTPPAGGNHQRDHPGHRRWPGRRMRRSGAQFRGILATAFRPRRGFVDQGRLSPSRKSPPAPCRPDRQDENHPGPVQTRRRQPTRGRGLAQGAGVHPHGRRHQRRPGVQVIPAQGRGPGRGRLLIWGGSGHSSHRRIWAFN